jgi:hypothetical protein
LKRVSLKFHGWFMIAPDGAGGKSLAPDSLTVGVPRCATRISALNRPGAAF